MDSTCRAVKDKVTRVGGGCVRCTLLTGRFLDLGLKIQATVYGFGPQNPGVRGGRDGMWRHPEACVEAKQRMRKARDRRIIYQDYPRVGAQASAQGVPLQ